MVNIDKNNLNIHDQKVDKNNDNSIDTHTTTIIIEQTKTKIKTCTGTIPAIKEATKVKVATQGSAL